MVRHRAIISYRDILWYNGESIDSHIELKCKAVVRCPIIFEENLVFMERKLENSFKTATIYYIVKYFDKNCFDNCRATHCIVYVYRGKNLPFFI